MPGLLLAALLSIDPAALPKGERSTLRACPAVANPAEVVITEFRLWPTVTYGPNADPVGYDFRACLAAPPGLDRARLGVKATLFRPTTGLVWGQGGQSPCEPKNASSPACRAERFEAGARIYWNPLFGDHDGRGPAGSLVHVLLDWQTGTRRHRVIYVGDACTVKKEEACPPSKLRKVHAEARTDGE